MLKTLQLKNFRSYVAIELDFDSGLTVISGPNAVGKTNLLEAVFVACTTKSFRAVDQELIHTGQDFYRVDVDFGEDAAMLSYSTIGDTHSKQYKLHNKKQPLHSVLGRNPVTLFEPNDMNLFMYGPDRRRRYLDIILSQSDIRYAKALQQYRKVLRHRNSLLHQAKVHGRKLQQDELFVWDMQLVEPAVKIQESRKKFAEQIAPLLERHYIEIASDDKRALLEYQPSIQSDQVDILEVMQRNYTKDTLVGFTTQGPHRDDIRALFGEHSIEDVASRGETRTFILALKLAELDYISDKTSKRPILLLDDVFSELDAARREHLVAALAQQQTLLTTTEVDNTITRGSYVIDLSGVKG